MSGNPLEGLVPELAAGRRAPAPALKAVRWAWVASTAPLRIRYAGQTDPVDADVTPLGARSSLRVGAQVLVFDHGGQLVVIGAAAGPATAWTDLVLAAPWTQYQAATSWGSPMVRSVDGVVQLRGMVTGGTTGTSSEPLAVLPAWARPARARIGTVVASDQVGTFQANTDGALFLRGAHSGGWVSLSSITFPL